MTQLTIDEKQKRLEQFKNNPNISKKISESLKEYYKTLNTLKTAKKVEQYDKNLLSIFNIKL